MHVLDDEEDTLEWYVTMVSATARAIAVRIRDRAGRLGVDVAHQANVV